MVQFTRRLNKAKDYFQNFNEEVQPIVEGPEAEEASMISGPSV